MKIQILDPHHITLDDTSVTFGELLKAVPLEDVISALSLAWERERQEFREEVAVKHAALTVLGTEIATLNTAAETTAKRTAQAIAAAKSLLNEQDHDKLRAGMAQIVAFAEAPETARQLAEAEAEAKAAQARVEALKAAL